MQTEIIPLQSILEDFNDSVLLPQNYQEICQQKHGNVCSFLRTRINQDATFLKLSHCTRVFLSGMVDKLNLSPDHCSYCITYSATEAKRLLGLSPGSVAKAKAELEAAGIVKRYGNWFDFSPWLRMIFENRLSKPLHPDDYTFRNQGSFFQPKIIGNSSQQPSGTRSVRERLFNKLSRPASPSSPAILPESASPVSAPIVVSSASLPENTPITLDIIASNPVLSQDDIQPFPPSPEDKKNSETNEDAINELKEVKEYLTLSPKLLEAIEQEASLKLDNLTHLGLIASPLRSILPKFFTQTHAFSNIWQQAVRTHGLPTALKGVVIALEDPSIKNHERWFHSFANRKGEFNKVMDFSSNLERIYTHTNRPRPNSLSDKKIAPETLSELDRIRQKNREREAIETIRTQVKERLQQAYDDLEARNIYEVYPLLKCLHSIGIKVTENHEVSLHIKQKYQERDSEFALRKEIFNRIAAILDIKAYCHEEN